MFKLAEPTYVILYPSLLGGEFIAYTLSVCLPNYNQNIMKWDNNRAIVNCPFGFSEELHRDFDQMTGFNYRAGRMGNPVDYSKPFRNGPVDVGFDEAFSFFPHWIWLPTYTFEIINPCPYLP